MFLTRQHKLIHSLLLISVFLGVLLGACSNVGITITPPDGGGGGDNGGDGAVLNNQMLFIILIIMILFVAMIAVLR